MSLTKFQQGVAEERLPVSKEVLPGIHRWDRHELDRIFDPSLYPAPASADDPTEALRRVEKRCARKSA